MAYFCPPIVLEKLCAGEILTDKDQKIHHAGLVSVLKQIHDDLDAAVFAAYGWPANLTDEQTLERLVALNAERAAEESRGLIRYLRPDFKSRPPTPSGPDAAETPPSPAGPRTKKRPRTLARSASEGNAAQPASPPSTADDDQKVAKRSRPTRREKTPKLPWPKDLPERTKAIQTALAAAGAPISAAELSSRFLRAQKSQVEEILSALVSLGLAHRLRGGKYTA